MIAMGCGVLRTESLRASEDRIAHGIGRHEGKGRSKRSLNLWTGGYRPSIYAKRAASKVKNDFSH
jgi:hypothetical protein